jgi:SNF2 family DNA or RNA helicase
MMITATIRKADYLAGEYSVYLSFEYNEQLLGIVHSMPARWHKPEREWEIPVRHLADFINQADKHEIQLKGNLNALVEKKVPNVKFDFKTNPFDHQIDGFNFGLTHNAWLLGDEQGLGKTWQVINIAIAKKQLNGYKHCLIVCGVNGLKWNWVKEIHTHSNEDAYILGQRGNKIGSNADKLTDINNIDDRPYFIITNVETLRDDKIAGALKALCDNGTIGMIAIDEVHKCKNPSSQQGKGILKLNADTKIAMTGTPLLNTPLDLTSSLSGSDMKSTLSMLSRTTFV